ncbi:MAG: class I SAM-dependent methyltransferase [Planctomycetes bacterium]|nr:class I SAM-dependent methyltransferase [Planctomycetota bacterium]
MSRMLQRVLIPFHDSAQYWERRYRVGGSSGAGSYGRLAEFKAEFLNAFVAEQRVECVIEFGCGDGHQLSLAEYPHYIGLDVSKQAISLCRETFGSDDTKSFFLFDPESFVDNQGLLRADLALSLDVIYHLVEDRVFHAYMTCLFQQAKQYVIVYSSNDGNAAASSPHVRHRRFTSWVEVAAPHWRLSRHISNRYPFDPKDPQETSFSDFYVFQRVEVTAKSDALLPPQFGEERCSVL